MRVVSTSLLALLAACSAPVAREAAPLRPLSASALSVRAGWTADLDSLRLALVALDSTLVNPLRQPNETAQIRAIAQFATARLAFKRAEFLSAYYEPSTTRAMNGPALPRVEEDEGPEVVFPPEGLQVVEEFIFVDFDSSRAARASVETRNVLDYVTRLQTTASRQRVTDDRVFDAAKMEMARIVALGISGFDSPVAKLSLAEAASALRGVHRALSAYAPTLGASTWSALDVAFQAAIVPLDSASELENADRRLTAFNDFDRLQFIVQAANPLAREIVRARDVLKLGTPTEARAFRMEAVTLFDSGAFAVEAFAPPGSVPATEAQVALGRALFFEPALSGDATRSCASCHDPQRAFTDGLARSAARSKRGVLRNSPTMINAGLQVGSFADLRATYLEDQVTDVLGNADEMHGNANASAVRLLADSAYARRFAAAFGSTDSVDGTELRRAVAAYVRSLQALNSPVDRALRGESTALDATERLGFNLFMGKAKCGTCHFAPLFNGSIPPNYQESEVEVLGVPARAVTRAARVDSDSGRFRQTRSAPHRHAFKVPTIRNAALTAPYMHNGVYRTLEQVVDFYNRGGGAGIGIQLDNQTLPTDSLQLSSSEQRALVRFIRALTDTTGTTRRAP